jgi:8-oxo-dGTP diphosphatase
MVKKIALVILEQPNGDIALQLRDDKPTIAHPNHWALFGGKIEAGEESKQAALREIAEELTIQLQPQRLTFLQKFELEPQKAHFLFHYPLKKELEQAQLTEGQRFRCWQPDEIQNQRLGDQSLVFSHLEMLNWFWQQNNQP